MWSSPVLYSNMVSIGKIYPCDLESSNWSGSAGKSVLHKLDNPNLILEPMVKEKKHLYCKLSSNSALVALYNPIPLNSNFSLTSDSADTL